MTRETLDRIIQKLEDELLVLNSMVATATLDAVQALKQHDLEAARRIYRDDALINARRYELENQCILTIATQQPLMATDLRLVASILEVVSELERMGDYAKGIARICLRIGKQPHIKPIIDLPRMAEIAVGMLDRAVEAFVKRDVELARSIPLGDDQVDAYYDQIYRELIAIILQNPSTIDQANLLMWAAHNLERMADRVTNICERAIYVVTAEMKELEPPENELLN
jgi:phosphate transport system protein